MSRRSKEDQERLIQMLTMVVQADVLTREEESEIMGICIDACRRAEIEDTEQLLMRRLGRVE